jgi:hypothetical protein
MKKSCEAEEIRSFFVLRYIANYGSYVEAAADQLSTSFP